MTLPSRLASFSLLAVLLGGTGCDTTPDYLQEQMRRDRLAGLGVARFDSAGAYQLAGMSTRRNVRLVALKPGELGADTLDAAYHTFHMRCGSCHDVPAPRSKPPYLWEATMSRMKKNASDAGLMPISDEEEGRILEFLRNRAAGNR